MSARNAAGGYEDGMFKPKNAVTRAEFVKMLINLFRADVEIPEDFMNPFSDIKEGDWFKDIMLKANIIGIVNGDGAFARPNDEISRQEMASMIYRMIKQQGKNLNTDTQIIKFADLDKIADWAYTPVLKMQAAGIILGYDGRFMPEENATRAMAAQMLYNPMNSFEEEETA